MIFIFPLLTINEAHADEKPLRYQVRDAIEIGKCEKAAELSEVWELEGTSSKNIGNFDTEPWNVWLTEVKYNMKIDCTMPTRTIQNTEETKKMYKHKSIVSHLSYLILGLK